MLSEIIPTNMTMPKAISRIPATIGFHVRFIVFSFSCQLAWKHCWNKINMWKFLSTLYSSRSICISPQEYILSFKQFVSDAIFVTMAGAMFCLMGRKNKKGHLLSMGIGKIGYEWKHSRRDLSCERRELGPGLGRQLSLGESKDQ